MTAAAADMAPYPFKHARERAIVLEFSQTIGAVGAVGALDKDDPAVTVAKDAGAGEYDITFPTAQKARLYWSLESPLGTVKTAWITALSATAGTATLITGNGGGTATDPASGDKIHVMLVLEQ